MIFFGAGASKAFGIPTLQELSDEIFKSLKKLGHHEVLDQITSSLQEYDMKVDFESLYTILKGLNNPYESAREAGPIAIFFLRNRSKLPKKFDYTEVLEDLKRIIYEKCNLDAHHTKRIREVYDNLFNSIKHHNIHDVITINETQIRNKNVLLNKILVTTNYDMSLELYFNEKGIKYLDGYEETGNPFIRNFNISLLDQLLNPNAAIYSTWKPIILKLHGSIFQFVQDKKMIKTILDPNNPTNPIEINVEKEMMIYPTKEKEILSQQYYPFFNIFKKIQWNRLLVIGYSFRDEPVNLTIVENLMKNESAKLIVFNPHPKEVINNMGYKIANDRIISIPQYFGDNEGDLAIQNLLSYLS